jgi:hypothetical protein
MKKCIARFGHVYLKLVRQVQNEEKTLANMEISGFAKKKSRIRCSHLDL